MRTSRACLLFAIVAAAGCGHAAVRPAAMAQAERLGQTPAAEEAKRLAPQAFASAEKLRRDAESAYRDGDPAGAQILSEHAIAAYEHALVLARLARATDAALRNVALLDAAGRTLAQVEEELARTTASCADIESRIKVAHDALPITPAGRADWGRDMARASAARSLALDARLLCAATRMLAPGTTGIDQAIAAVDEVDRRLTTRAGPAPIDAAMRARAACLSLLTQARRAAGATSSTGKADELLADLSAADIRAAGLDPLRDERGVFVTLRGLSDGTGLADPVRALGRVAKTHPEFPVQIVVHGTSSRKDEIVREQALGSAVATALADAGAPAARIEVQAAGAAHPIVPSRSATPERNQRVEIVFVDPGG